MVARGSPKAKGMSLISLGVKKCNNHVVVAGSSPVLLEIYFI